MKINRIHLLAILCAAPVAAHAGLDIGINIGIPAGQGEVIIRDEPPAPREEIIGRPPAPGYVWIQGHWQRHHDRWEWISGHWEAPHDHMVWVEGRWDRRHGGYVWVEGHWDAMQAPVTVVTQPQSPVEVFVNEAPPPPRHERIYPAPGPDYFWIGGHWNWQGRWVWISGRYERHPHYHPGAAWIDGHWENRRGGFVWIEGSWR